MSPGNRFELSWDNILRWANIVRNAVKNTFIQGYNDTVSEFDIFFHADLESL